MIGVTFAKMFAYKTLASFSVKNETFTPEVITYAPIAHY